MTDPTLRGEAFRFAHVCPTGKFFSFLRQYCRVVSVSCWVLFQKRSTSRKVILPSETFVTKVDKWGICVLLTYFYSFYLIKSFEISNHRMTIPGNHQFYKTFLIIRILWPCGNLRQINNSYCLVYNKAANVLNLRTYERMIPLLVKFLLKC